MTALNVKISDTRLAALNFNDVTQPVRKGDACRSHHLKLYLRPV